MQCGKSGSIGEERMSGREEPKEKLSERVLLGDEGESYSLFYVQKHFLCYYYNISVRRH